MENTQPTACLSTSIGGTLLDMHYDSSTDTLITITSDRRIKLWDLSGQASAPRHTPRTKPVLSRGASELKTIPNVGVVKFSASVSKYDEPITFPHKLCFMAVISPCQFPLLPDILTARRSRIPDTSAVPLL